MNLQVIFLDFIIWLFIGITRSVLSMKQGDGTSSFSVYGCEDSTIRLECPENSLISISKANYGRLSLEICNPKRLSEGWSVECINPRSMRVLSDRCDGLPFCDIIVSSQVFGNLCYSMPKYLEVHYECTPFKHRRKGASSIYIDVGEK